MALKKKNDFNEPKNPNVQIPALGLKSSSNATTMLLLQFTQILKVVKF